ncbi:hypothetical protein ACIBG7_35965 [Nonomuraea sp. NPDC050328]|uniref:hypothetical protein n=1 Tax=Nonomuraea sp. NPDC050328 TaxID=3364361 RepID=UPI00379033E7
MSPMKIVVAGAALLLATGCQLGPAPVPRSASSAEPSATQPASAPTPTPLPSDQVLASRTAAADQHYKLKIDLLAADREGRLVTVNYAVTVTEHDRAFGWTVGDAFSAVPSDTPDADGLYLVDKKNAKKHLVAKDVQGACACTANTESVAINTGQKVVFTASFAAPPEDVTKVDVYIPLAGTFADVPLT